MEAASEASDAQEDLPRGPAGAEAGGAAPPFADYLARQHFPRAWEVMEAMDEDEKKEALDDYSIESDGSYPYYRFTGNYYTSRWKVPPWNKVGKLYFKKPNGSSSYCTANVASGNSVILTAAHCVYTRGQGWNSNFVFVPADRYGEAPYGSYGWTMATVSPNWISNGGRRWDLAAIKLANNPSSGLPVTSYVGWLGRSWNQPYSEYHLSVGYASNLSTQYTHACYGMTGYSSAEGADVLVQGCDMTYGSSGGGWLRNYTHNSHSGNHVNAVVSGPHIGSFGSAYVGPRFSSNNLVPVCNAIGC
ncbi:trypsin-like serine peptidase [Marilutibacter alkalisoli]|uniref:Trypsin-like serine protease n=1 Tax=Marilutibacter alkalisoli TaxID=2591633 RepID=A0A514BS41_9GAMM|nr:trypsin-like peptidase domain-containing protein [Lysobacter alkalisoli]QDH70197.1 trypsin-like serine protease [Lysobacter alkalisoli]